MTLEQRNRLIKELKDLLERTPVSLAESFWDDAVAIVERVLSKDGCFHFYDKGRCPHDGCPNYKSGEKPKHPILPELVANDWDTKELVEDLRISLNQVITYLESQQKE